MSWQNDLVTWWNQGDDNAAVKRNREYAAYTSARNAGKTDAKFKDWQKENKEDLKKIDGKSVQSPKETVKMIAEMAPVIGDGVALSNAYDAAKEGDWGTVGMELGTTAAGWVPFAGPLAKAGIRGAKNIDLAAGAVKQGWDPDYAKLFADEVMGKKGPLAKSVGASANFGTDAPIYKVAEIDTPKGKKAHPKALEGEYTKRFGLPNTPEARKATSDIMADATAIRRGDRVDDPSISIGQTEVHPNVNPAGQGRNRLFDQGVPGAPETLPNNPQSLVDYAMPTPEKWDEVYQGKVPYPTKKPGILTAKERDILPTGKPNRNYTGKEEPFSTVEPGWPSKGPGRPKFGDIAKNLGPLSSKPTANIPAPVKQLMDRQDWSLEKATEMAKRMGLI